MDVGALLMKRNVQNVRTEIKQNRTPWTKIFSHNVRMEFPKDRLKQARLSAGFETPTDAARNSRDLNVNTLISHENGNREISRKAAEKYGRIFGVDPGWLLYGGEHEAQTLDKRLREALLLANEAPPTIQERIIAFIKFEMDQLKIST